MATCSLALYFFRMRVFWLVWYGAILFSHIPTDVLFSLNVWTLFIVFFYLLCLNMINWHILICRASVEECQLMARQYVIDEKQCITFSCGLNLHLTAFISADTTVATFLARLALDYILLDFLTHLFFLLSYTRVSSPPFIFPPIPLLWLPSRPNAVSRRRTLYFALGVESF